MLVNKKLLKGSIILLVSFNIYNALNFFFHFAMVRMMEVVEYGILASLFSIIYIFGVFTESIQVVIAKYSSREKKGGKLKNILRKSLRKSFNISLLVLLLYSFVAIPLSFLMKISYPLMLLNGSILIFSFVSPITRGILQGRKRFSALGINMIFESIIKLSVSILLVYFGWSIYGALIGSTLGAGGAFILSFVGIRDITKEKEVNASTEGIYGYTKPTLFIITAILIFYSLDVIVAKIFFSEELAGIYAVSSILAKIIFFGTQPISRAMFPISAENNENKKKSENIFINAFTILTICIVVALTLFYLFPELIIKIFSGKEIEKSAEILFYLGIAISLMSLSNLIILYKLSLGKIKGYPYLFIFIILEIFLLSFFSKDLVQFSIAFITASAIFFWGSILLMND